MTELRDLPLVDFIPALSPEYKAPYHLLDWCHMIERAATESVRGLCSIPIRHGKTQTTLHGIVWLLLQDPTIRIIHLSHSFERAQVLGKRLRQLADAAGVGPERGNNTIQDWSNKDGGGVVIMSAEQSKLGYDVHVLTADDPIDEHGAMDPKIRESVDETISHYTARTQRGGKPGSVLLVMSPWHPDDPVGRRLQRKAVTWEYVRKPAIIDEGEPTERAFAPDVWDLPALKQMRAELAEKDPTERIWHAQLMCDPKPAGGDLFGPPHYYTELPNFQYRRAYGVDFAYTNGDGSDWFARIIGRVYGKKLYIMHASRMKIDMHQIESTCKADILKHGRAPFYSYMSGPEIGFANQLIERGVPLAKLKARYNKRVRAERTIKRWNDGNILLPADTPENIHTWVPGLVHRVALFRGAEKDTDDDEIDALVSMADGAMGGAVAGEIRTFGKRYSGF